VTMDERVKNIQARAVIDFLTKEDQSPKNIYERMVKVYSNDAPSYSMVKKWAALFKSGRVSLEDDPREGRPTEATTDEMCQKVEDLVMSNRRIRIIMIAKELGLSTGSVYNILHHKLGMSKICARWVPRMLTPEMKQRRLEASRLEIDRINKDPDSYYSRLVTGDETWLHHYDPDTKQESMQWKHHGSPVPKKFRTQASAGKIMATVFWDEQGLLLIEYMPHKTTITGAYYATVIRRLRQAIKEKRRGKLRRGVLLLQDNAAVHTAGVSMQAVTECGFELVPHPPYSPDLAPSDFFLFSKLKKHLRGRRFANDCELKAAAESWFETQDKSFFSAGIRQLSERYNKCLAVKGGYVEK
jgi:[histone H3]-lysine36 N-dimethyltransferase SETMAR